MPASGRCPIFKVYQIIVTLLCTSKQKTRHNALRQGPEERRLRERHRMLEDYRRKLTVRISSLGTRLSPEGGDRVRPTTRRGGVSSPRPRTSTLPPRCVFFSSARRGKANRLTISTVQACRSYHQQAGDLPDRLRQAPGMLLRIL